MFTPDHIVTLKHHERIVVGTNYRGDHAGGAAWQAEQVWGLIMGVAEGLCGQTYAFPTLDYEHRQLSEEQLRVHADRFKRTCEANPGLTFLLTKVGCGIAGYSEERMKSLFQTTPPNVVKPEGW